MVSHNSSAIDSKNRGLFQSNEGVSQNTRNSKTSAPSISFGLIKAQNAEDIPTSSRISKKNSTTNNSSKVQSDDFDEF